MTRKNKILLCMLFAFILLAGSVYAEDSGLIINPNFTMINGTLIPEMNLTINDTVLYPNISINISDPVPINGTPINLTCPSIACPIMNFTPIPIAPEAVIRYNEENQDFKVTGGMIIPVIDISLSEECKGNKCLQKYILTGNNNGTLSLELEHKKNKNKISIKILSLSYNDGEAIYPEKNSFTVSNLKKYLIQRLSVKNKFLVRTNYNKKMEETKVIINEEDGIEQRYTSENKIATQLMTNRGKLEYGLMEYISLK